MTRAVIALCLVLCAAALAHALPWLLTQRPGLPTLLSVWTLGAMYLAGSNPRRGWTLALWGQIPWALYTYYSGSYGFVWLNIGLTAVYVRNLWLHRPGPSAADEIARLRAFIDAAFVAHPNLDRDIELLSDKR